MADLQSLLSSSIPRPAADSVDVRREQFAQARASLALEGLAMDDGDLSIQERVAAGTLTHDQAVALYRSAHARRA